MVEVVVREEELVVTVADVVEVEDISDVDEEAIEVFDNAVLDSVEELKLG